MGRTLPASQTPVGEAAEIPSSVDSSDDAEGVALPALWARVSDQQERVSLDRALVESLVVFVLRAEGYSRGGVEVAFVNDETIAQLHEQFMDIPGPTDVITFPMHDPEDPHSSLGEVVVSTDTAIRQAPEFGLDPVDESLLYVVHGVLHIAGYDDQEVEERDQMTARQLQLLLEWKQAR